MKALDWAEMSGIFLKLPASVVSLINTGYSSCTISCSCIPLLRCVKVSEKDVEYKRIYQRHALKQAVIAEAYPPSITVKAVHSQVPEHLRCPRLIHLHVSGTKSGGLTFPVEVSEEREGKFVHLV